MLIKLNNNINVEKTALTYSLSMERTRDSWTMSMLIIIIKSYLHMITHIVVYRVYFDSFF